MPRKPKQPGTLSPRQYRALEALLTQGRKETLAEVANRAGISGRQLTRYFNDPDFIAAYNGLMDKRLLHARMRMLDALIESGTDIDSRGMAANQRTFWQLCGKLVNANANRVEIKDPDSILSQILGIPPEDLP
jgi:AcrR family transcriptional regulator